MRANPRTRIRPAAHAHTRIHIYTPMYARIRAREGKFLTTNLLYSIAKPSLIISPTAFTSIIQSLYNPYPYWHHIDCSICTNCHYLSSSDTHFQPYTSIFQLSTNNSIISRSSLIYYHCRTSSRTNHIPSYLMSSPTHHSINMSVCYKTLSILYILAALSYIAVSHLLQITCFPNPTIIIFIMETIFRANHQQFPLCIIIHLLIFVMKFI